MIGMIADFREYQVFRSDTRHFYQLLEALGISASRRKKLNLEFTSREEILLPLFTPRSFLLDLTEIDDLPATDRSVNTRRFKALQRVRSASDKRG